MDDKALILQAQNGNAGAFEQLVFRYDKNVLSIIARFVRSSDDAKDLYQDVFIRAYRGLKGFKLQSEFPTWLYRITTNVCLTFLAKKKERYEVPIQPEENEDLSSAAVLTDSSASPEKLLESRRFEEQVKRGLEQISPSQRTAFTLKYIEGFSIKEVAVMMNCSEGNIKKTLFLASRRLRKYVGDIK